MMTTCPKCHYIRQPKDHAVHPDLCPKCGIAYQKWLQRQAALAASQARAAPAEYQTIEAELSDATESFWTRGREELLYVPERVDPISFWGRVVTLVAFSVWGLSFIFSGIDWQEIGGSFMHNINLPFHEFGHVLFSPFGRFMAILGGSLFQVLMPLGLMAAFIIQRRDPFAASLMVWWSGQSFIDVAPYIADAPYRAIPLIRGMSEDAHDWGNLLTMTGMLGSANTLSWLSFAIGTLLIITGVGWGAYILKLQYQRLEP